MTFRVRIPNEPEKIICLINTVNNKNPQLLDSLFLVVATAVLCEGGVVFGQQTMCKKTPCKKRPHTPFSLIKSLAGLAM